MTGADWDWQIVFDGGSQGNPGRGYGSYRLRPRDEAWGPVVSLQLGARVTNNEAEYRTLIAALEDLAVRVGEPAGARVQVLGDSQLVMAQVKGEYKVRAPHLLPYRDRVRALASRFKAVDFRWHRRVHSVELLGH